MISSITIKNFGLMESLSINFSDGLNIFTGETGAGKSILIDAMRCALGEKISSEQVRDKQKKCTIEISFLLEDKKWQEHPLISEYIEDEQIIITRTFTADGKSKNKVNGLNVTVSSLKEIGDFLVDLHGAHDHQMLFDQKYHIQIVDRLSDISNIKEDYQKEYNIYKQLTNRAQQLQQMENNSTAELDILSYQLKELQQVPLNEKHYTEIIEKYERSNNSEKLYSSATQLLNIVENDSASITSLVSEGFSPLKELNKLDGSTNDFTEILQRIQDDTSSLQDTLTAYIEGLSFEPNETELISKQYDIYINILKKYGPDIHSANSHFKQIKERYDTIVDIEHNTGQLNIKIQESQRTLSSIAQKISSKRKNTSKILQNTIKKELKELGINNVEFDCRITTTKLNANGKDEIIFYISPNKGETLKPLSKIVSSGEAARVMLALKKALTKVDPIPVLIFDEIDAQIGGRLGTITGKKLRELSSNRQVILITHLPQIASFAKNHFKVRKDVIDNRTFSTVEQVSGQARIKEIAQMMSGENETEISVHHAEDMLNKAKK